MRLTDEQLAIVATDENLCINAVAGSGKTSTLIAYSRAKPSNNHILYLAFNRAIRIEAAHKFIASGAHHVEVETAHSLAFRHIVPKHRYLLKHNGYNNAELVELLGLVKSVDPLQVYFVAAHVNRLMTMFCNSAVTSIDKVAYQESIDDAKVRGMVKGYYRRILRECNTFWQMMELGHTPVTHDFYLKKFQLTEPVLPYDYILFDEGQDASAVMLDVFLKQPAVKVIVGDIHQQIYGWRHAVNSLAKVDFPVKSLTQSFRFNQNIAHLACEALRMKQLIRKPHDIQISGKGLSKAGKLKAVLARTNLGLLMQAIEHVSPPRAIRSLYFEGNFNAYTYADDGTSLYDVIHLYNQEHRKIRNPLIKSMKTLAELKTYAEDAQDHQLRMMAEVVKKYGNELPKLLNKIKQKHVADHDRLKAEMIFSTVHRCKGMEYDVVHLADDFMTEKKIRRIMEHETDKKPDFDKLNEEINLLYVAITRTKNLLYIPDTLVPDGYRGTENIRIVRTEHEKEAWFPDPPTEFLEQLATDGFSYHQRKKWNNDTDDLLLEMFLNGKRFSTIAKKLETSEGAVRSRIRKIAGTTNRALARQGFAKDDFEMG